MYQGVARRLALVICGARGGAADAAQEAFVRAWTALGGSGPGSPSRPFLLRIVANEARNRRRTAGRREGYELKLAKDRSSGEAAPLPEAAVLADERRVVLAAAVA